MATTPRKYRKVSVQIWNDEKFRDCSPECKLIFLFILTHPTMTSFGAMRGSELSIAGEIQLTPEGYTEGFREAFQEGIHNGFYEVDPKACLIVVPKFLKHNAPDNPNVVLGWGSLVDQMPESALLTKHLQQVKEYLEPFGEPFLKAFENGIGNGIGILRTQNSELRIKIPPTPRGGVDGLVGDISGKRQAPKKADPLAGLPRLLDAYQKIGESILRIHPKAQLPISGTRKDFDARAALAKLVTKDGYTEQDVIDVLRWVVKGEDDGAVFWQQQFHALSALRKVSNGASKFTRMHERMQREKKTTSIQKQKDPYDDLMDEARRNAGKVAA